MRLPIAAAALMGTLLAAVPAPQAAAFPRTAPDTLVAAIAAHPVIDAQYRPGYPYRWRGRFWRYRWAGRYYNHRRFRRGVWRYY